MLKGSSPRKEQHNKTNKTEAQAVIKLRYKTRNQVEIHNGYKTKAKNEK